MSDKLAKRPAAYHVSWLDSITSHGWSKLSDAELDLRCETVGFVIKRSKDALVLTSSLCWSATSPYDCPQSIPRRAILKMTKLTLPDK